MKGFGYLIRNFFTHKDYLAPASEIPGTLFTPLHYAFSAVLLFIVVFGALRLCKKQEYIKRVFTVIWVVLAILEPVVVLWESVSGKTVGLDLRLNLSLYPCSIFLYVMPFFLWGNELCKKIAGGYLCTLGLIGAAINFVYPAIRLASYSCISFAGFHTFLYHGSMLFVCLVLLVSGEHRYTNVEHWWELFLPCIPTLLLSIPANIVNYTFDADYMFFRGKFPLIAQIGSGLSEGSIFVLVYLFYIFVPALFYLPSYLCSLVQRREEKLLCE